MPPAHNALAGLLATSSGRLTVGLEMLALLAMLPFLLIEACTIQAYGWGWFNAWNLLDALTYVFQVPARRRAPAGVLLRCCRDAAEMLPGCCWEAWLGCWAGRLGWDAGMLRWRAGQEQQQQPASQRRGHVPAGTSQRPRPPLLAP